MAKNDSTDKTKKTRRVKGEGAIFQRESDGKWVGRIVIGRDQESGQPIRKTVYGQNRPEVKKKLDELRAKYDGASFVDADKITVGQWLDKWLAVYGSPPNVEAASAEFYERMIRLYLQPGIGHIKLHRLQGMAIQQMLNDMTKPLPEAAAEDKDAEAEKKKPAREKGKPIPGPKSTTTVKAVYSTLAMALRVAVKQGLLRKSPADNVTLPAMKKKPKEALTREQWDTLLATAQAEPDLFAAIVVEWATGIRRGELLALRWDEDIDLKAGTITIQQAIKIRSKKYGGVGPGATKTDASRRLLVLPPEAVKVLRVHETNQKKARMKAGEAWKETGYVFTTPNGYIWDPRSWSKRFKALANAAGLPNGVHQLRHDMSSRLADAGVPIKEAQYQLGHATVTMLLDTYAHRLNGSQNRVTKAISKSAPGILKEKAKPARAKK